MPSDAPLGTMLNFSTSDLPSAHRVPFWLEVFARQVVHVEIELQSDKLLQADASALALPGVRLLWCDSSTPAIWNRTKGMLSDGDDDFTLLLSLEGAATRTQLGRDLDVRAGEAVGIVQNETALLRYKDFKYVAIILPHSALAPTTLDIEQSVHRVIDRNTPSLELLRSYVALLRKKVGLLDPDPYLQMLVAGHIRDLVALSVGATADGTRAAARGGVRAARLQAMKAAITESPGVELAELARQQGVTPRYVQRLFAEDGTTFTDFVLEKKLACAKAMLVGASYADWTIGAIAYQVGFGDLSHFNRTFKRRFGKTPSEVRHETGQA
jgi:AraC-like DNA-binding protein